MSPALNVIFRLRRQSLILSLLRIVRDPHTAEDLAQEAYIRVCRAPEAGGVERVEPFLHQTARNIAFDHQRRCKARRKIEAVSLDDQMVDIIADDTPSVERILQDRQRLKLLRQTVSRLPRRTQIVMHLSRIEGWTNRRIAAHLGVSERTVFNDLKMALAHCVEQMGGFDGD